MGSKGAGSIPALFFLMKVAAIVVAAGQGSRMGSEIPKVFLPLGGIPMVAVTIRALATVELIGEIVVVVAPEHVPLLERVLEEWGPAKTPVHHALGGAERQDSVAAGLAAVSAETEIVAVHDAARPFVPPARVTAVIQAAAAEGAALLAVPSRDTVKLVDDHGLVTQTPPRQRVWLAQTPQVFRAGLLREAHARARQDGIVATDDAALVERMGRPVKVVPGEASNVKITTPADLQWAEWYLRSGAPR